MPFFSDLPFFIFNRTIASDTILGRDISSHDHPMDPVVWIHPWGTRGLGSHKPTYNERWLAYHTWWVQSFLKQYGIRRITPQVLYTCFTTHYFSDVGYSSHVKYFRYFLSHVSHIISKNHLRLWYHVKLGLTYCKYQYIIGEHEVHILHKQRTYTIPKPYDNKKSSNNLYSVHIIFILSMWNNPSQQRL